jgi:hypothetical protein
MRQLFLPLLNNLYTGVAYGRADPYRVKRKAAWLFLRKRVLRSGLNAVCDETWRWAKCRNISSSHEQLYILSDGSQGVFWLSMFDSRYKLG